MMSLETIRSMSRDAALTAARKNLTPLVFWVDDLIDTRLQFPIPNLGDYDPPGWMKVDTLFCDTSGFGTPREPALTLAEFTEYIRSNLANGYGYGIIESGQFQCSVGVFKKEKI